MSMNILTNVSSLAAQRSLVDANKMMESSMERLTTGKRINSASDDAAGLATAMRMEAQIRSTQLEIAKLEAEVANIQTMAAVNVAKVDQIENEPQLKIVELQSKLQTKREELDLRERLSALTNEMRKEQSDTAAASKMAVEALKNLDTTGGTE